MFRKHSKGPGLTTSHNVTKATYKLAIFRFFQKLFHRKYFTTASLQHALCSHSSIFCLMNLKISLYLHLSTSFPRIFDIPLSREERRKPPLSWTTGEGKDLTLNQVQSFNYYPGLNTFCKWISMFVTYKDPGIFTT